MMNPYELHQQVEAIASMLDAQEQPEAYEYLTGLLFDTEEVTESPYEIATELMKADSPAPLPAFLIDFITELYEEEIEDGNADAMNDLGAHYYDGWRGLEQSFSKAVALYHRAAENGSRAAQENLGYCYYYGRDMERDYEKAFHYFALGAFDGHLISLYKIGDMYQNGYFVEKNPTEAFRIYDRCIGMMTDADAPIVAGPVFLRLGNCFLYGNGVEENAKNAQLCFQQAERYLYDMVAGGDVMYKKSLQAAIDGQAKAREKLNEKLPDKQWLGGKRD